VWGALDDDDDDDGGVFLSLFFSLLPLSLFFLNGDITRARLQLRVLKGEFVNAIETQSWFRVLVKKFSFCCFCVCFLFSRTYTSLLKLLQHSLSNIKQIIILTVDAKPAGPG
jgi:hypothetical protein